MSPSHRYTLPFVAKSTMARLAINYTEGLRGDVEGCSKKERPRERSNESLDLINEENATGGR